MLPATAGDFLAEVGPERGLIVEVFGSTEAGGIASRRWREGEPPPWTLLQDVSFAEPGAGHGDARGGDPEPDEGDVPLAVRSPRLAFRPGEEPAATLRTDDFVAPLDDRTFRFVGRRARLVKVNGRRINLDQVEHSLRAILDCEDLALLPVADRMIGEHIDLLLVLRVGTTLADLDLKAAFTAISVRPRRVRVVPQIDRSETGKLRQVQTSPTTEAEVAA
jgi:acyl-coenzyme A synthetase/AMP-(fatty) acid ligase